MNEVSKGVAIAQVYYEAYWRERLNHWMRVYLKQFGFKRIPVIKAMEQARKKHPLASGFYGGPYRPYTMDIDTYFSDDPKLHPMSSGRLRTFFHEFGHFLKWRLKMRMGEQEISKLEKRREREIAIRGYTSRFKRLEESIEQKLDVDKLMRHFKEWDARTPYSPREKQYHDRYKQETDFARRNVNELERELKKKRIAKMPPWLTMGELVKLEKRVGETEYVWKGKDLYLVVKPVPAKNELEKLLR